MDGICTVADRLRTPKRPPARIYPERPKPPSGEVIADLVARKVIVSGYKPI